MALLDLNSNSSVNISIGMNVTLEFPDRNSVDDSEALAVAAVLFPVLMGIVLTVGILLNALVVCVTLSTNAIMTCASSLFLNLAVSDLVFLVFCLPIQCAYFASQLNLHLGRMTCKLLYFIQYTTLGASIYTMTVISVFRLFAVVLPLKSFGRLTCRHAVVSSLVVWIFVSLVNIPILIYYDEPDQKPGIHICTLHMSTMLPFYLNVFIMTGMDFFLPLVVTGFASLYLLWELCKSPILQPRRYSINSTKACDTCIHTRNKQLVVLIGAVDLSFLICWGPAQILFIMIAAGYQIPRILDQAILAVIVYSLAFGHSCVNPILYNFASRGFRRATRKFLVRWIRKLKCVKRTDNARESGTGHHGIFKGNRPNDRSKSQSKCQHHHIAYVYETAV
ncbi:allatostatin-A receptor [Lingula anatina]|uniref:Allatostatin-A receptor n=1 Tax=Lingula anatina TaxID=7574 RepID=A0A1S3HZF2_LINAN|nr:allatostatin-A receptor [Lingula anatina]|eukprot:XP_013391393.1 allatostatin-A receptor [Lingula anatina]